MDALQAPEPSSGAVEQARRHVMATVHKAEGLGAYGQIACALNAFEAALRAQQAEQIERLSRNLAQVMKAEEAYRANERQTFQKLSDILTGGNAGQWEEIIHSASEQAEQIAQLQQEIERLRKMHRGQIERLMRQRDYANELLVSQDRTKEYENVNHFCASLGSDAHVPSTTEPHPTGLLPDSDRPHEHYREPGCHEHLGGMCHHFTLVEDRCDCGIVPRDSATVVCYWHCAEASTNGNQ
jgi:uncharacterized small protein (DUF1192 family)